MLAAAVRHKAKLARLSPDGKHTEGEHVLAGVKRGIAKPDALHGPPVPWSFAYLLDWLDELARGRSYVVTMVGTFPAPLTYGQLAEWARLMGREPTPGDVDALFALDAVARNPDVGG